MRLIAPEPEIERATWSRIHDSPLTSGRGERRRNVGGADGCKDFSVAGATSRRGEPLIQTAQPDPGLSGRELAIVEAVFAGCTKWAIARRLAMPAQAVEDGIREMYQRLGVSNELGLVLFAVHNRCFQAGDEAGPAGRDGRRTAADAPARAAPGEDSSS